MSRRCRFIIDTDGGADDAIAIMMALRHPDVQVEAITTVVGNVGVEQATRNALYLVELCGARVPVYQGSGRPMLREPSNAQSVHDKDGMGDLGLDPPQNKPQSEHAVDALIRCIRDAPGEITVVVLGPLTNVALALLKEPELAFALRGVCMMGGAVNALGNVTPSAEFNVWADPEAAKVVLHSGAPVTMVGWELTWGDMHLKAEERNRLRASGSRCAEFAVDCTRKVVEVFECLLSATRPDRNEEAWNFEVPGFDIAANRWAAPLRHPCKTLAQLECMIDLFTFCGLLALAKST